MKTINKLHWHYIMGASLWQAENAVVTAGLSDMDVKHRSERSQLRYRIPSKNI